MKKYILTLSALLLSGGLLQAETIAEYIARVRETLAEKKEPVAVQALTEAKSNLNQAKTDLKHVQEATELNKRQADEKKAAKRDQHQVEIKALQDAIAVRQAQIAELKKQHAQELIDLQTAGHKQEQGDLIKVQTLSEAVGTYNKGVDAAWDWLSN